MNKKSLFCILLVFLFSVGLRLWNLNQMGRTWDENAQIEQGYDLLQLIQKKDFNNPVWYIHPDHPPLSKYLYGFAAQFDIASFDKTGKPIFSYDWTISRLVSVLFSSLTVVLVTLLGLRYASRFVGVTAGLILAFLPFLLGLSQLATIESILIFFFTASVLSFMEFLKKPSGKNILVLGICVGLAFETKFTNVLLIPILLWIYIVFCRENFKKIFQEVLFKKMCLMFLVSFLVFFVLWPMPWFHMQEVIFYTYKTRVENTVYSVPEVFFGRLMLVPKVYYIVMFLITTPLVFLLFFFYGLFLISGKTSFQNTKQKSMILVIKKFFLISFSSRSYLKIPYKRWILYSLVIWFSVPFLQSFYNFRQHGIRYIIEIYAPFSLISAIGIEYVTNHYFYTKKARYIFLACILGYAFFVLYSISPYYLDYFNEVVSGTKNVYEKRLFQLGWWGQGIRGAVYYLEKNAPVNSRVGLAVVPLGVVPPSQKLQLFPYEDGKKYDYVLVSYFNVVREGFNDSKIRSKYKLIYSVSAGGARLIDIYLTKL